MPSGIEVVPIKLSVAEPYSWLEDRNALKFRAAVVTDSKYGALFKKDKGHPWDFAKCEVTGKPFDYEVRTSAGLPYYTVAGAMPFTLLNYGQRDPFTFEGTDVQLSNYGALEYGAAAPTSDQFSVSAFVGELREGLPALIPSLLKTRKGNPNDLRYALKKQIGKQKAAGSDYLNVQFGWIPLLNDVRGIATALAVATTAVTGPSISTHRRRDGTVKDATMTAASPVVITEALRFQAPALGQTGQVVQTQSGVTSTGSLIQRHEIYTSFEAEFLRLPTKEPVMDPYLEKLNELMRFDLTPADLWQLAPWSWLVDWFVDIGGLIESWQAATSSNIMSLFAYAMRKEVITTSIFASDVRASSTAYRYTGPKSAYTEIKSTRYQRIKANPFGYILDPTVNLNVGQLAILAALGLTKTRR